VITLSFLVHVKLFYRIVSYLLFGANVIRFQRNNIAASVISSGILSLHKTLEMNWRRRGLCIRHTVYLSSITTDMIAEINEQTIETKTARQRSIISHQQTADRSTSRYSCRTVGYVIS